MNVVNVMRPFLQMLAVGKEVDDFCSNGAVAQQQRRCFSHSQDQLLIQEADLERTCLKQEPQHFVTA